MQISKIALSIRPSVIVFAVLSGLLLGSAQQLAAQQISDQQPSAQPPSGQQPAPQAAYTLKPTPKTVAWGYYDAKATPVLRIKSGDTVEIQTLITNSPKRLEDAGVPPEQVEQSLRDITAQVTDKGPGGHILTGPIYIEGAEIGDVLEIKILSIKLAIPYAYNGFGPGRGYLPDDYPYAKMEIIPLDEKRMVAHFAEGIEIPLHPFFAAWAWRRRKPQGASTARRPGSWAATSITKISSPAPRSICPCTPKARS